MTTKTVKLKGWIVWEKWRFDEFGSFKWQGRKPSQETSEHYACLPVCEHEIEIPVPDSFDPRAPMVEQLEAQKKKLQADFTARVTQINAQIQSLMALECEG